MSLISRRETLPFRGPLPLIDPKKRNLKGQATSLNMNDLFNEDDNGSINFDMALVYSKETGTSLSPSPLIHVDEICIYIPLN